mmetsp:Transcript_21688/g.31562  ORF Transcript_21688/g.31562 Transcript_21688/m.31562 type:complete len:215 (-) Transcript_21688:14-658(-)
MGRVVDVVYKSSKVSLSLSSRISFTDFEKWARSRFGISSSKSMMFRNRDGHEVIPSFIDAPTDNSLENMWVEVLEDESITEVGTTPSETVFNPSSMFNFSYIYPVLVLAYMLGLIVSSPSDLPHPMSYFDNVSVALTWLGVKSKDQLSLYKELLIAFISWPVGYFYIRRALNPAYGLSNAFSKFGTDTFFGALAACGVVLFKYFVKNSLDSYSS